MLLDFDRKGMPDEVKARFDKLGGYWPALCSVMPALATAARVERQSTSACLVRSDTGERLPGSGGLHVYVRIKDGSDVKRFLETLHGRCWLAGVGWLMVGAAGQLLDRSIVDRMVFGPERLVFEGAPILEPPLVQDQELRRPKAYDGGILDSELACPPLRIVEKNKLQHLRALEEQRLAGDVDKARAEFVEQQAVKIAKKTNKPIEVARTIVERQCDGVLLPDVVLPFDSAELENCTVADVLADPESFEGATLADPLEGVDYGRGKARIMRRADGSPWIHSFAHGRTVYELTYDAATVRKLLEATSKAELIDAFVRLALVADLSPIELDDIVANLKERTGRGSQVIKQTLREARGRQDERRLADERKRLLAGRTDLRPQIPVPPANSPWLPVMAAIENVLVDAREAEPPMRDLDDHVVQKKLRRVPNMHAFVHANESAPTDLPAPEQPLLSKMSELECAELIEQHIDYVYKDWSVHLPTPFVRHFLRRRDALPVASGIATLPLVLGDGAMLAGFGLDRKTGIIFDIPPAFRLLLPQRKDCTPDAAAEAMRFLMDNWLVDVATDVTGKCTLIASALSLIERSLLPDRPTFFVTAGQRGGGKTTTITMVMLAVTGIRPAAAAWSPNEEERRKALLSYFIEGVPYVLWDNIPRGARISCPHIEKACTAQWYSDRRLGVSEAVTTSAASVFFFTGNNIAPTGDLASRSLQVRLEVDRPDPENRTFEHSDVVGWTLANRAKILRALYTILLGNPQLDEDRNAPGRTRFKTWWRLIGSAVENAARTIGDKLDFARLFLNAEADDEGVADLGEALKALGTLGPQFKAADVVNLINSGSITDPRAATLREFLFPQLPGGQFVTAKGVGRRLGDHVDAAVTVCGDVLTLKKFPGADNTATYFIRRSSAS